jgi:hypothetical protein
LRRDFGVPAERPSFTVFKRNSPQLQWRASSILRTFAAPLSGQVAKPSHLPVANRSSAPLHRFRHRQGFVDDHRLQGGASALLGRGNRGVSFTERS